MSPHRRWSGYPQAAMVRRRRRRHPRPPVRLTIAPTTDKVDLPDRHRNLVADFRWTTVRIWQDKKVASTQTGPFEPNPQRATGRSPTRLPAIARYWWLTASRGLVALTLALAIALAGHSTARLLTFLALYWMTGGLITLRLALAIRPRRGARLALAAGMVAVVGGALVLLRDRLSGPIHPGVLVDLLGTSAVLIGLLRVVGGFAAERRFGRRWTLGGIVLGTLEVTLGTVLLLAARVGPGLLGWIVVAWGLASGSLLIAEGIRLRRFAQSWRAATATPQGHHPAGEIRPQ